MTSWSPSLDSYDGPRYLAIAEALQADIAAGTLPRGARLPTHRDLAWRLRVTVGTVSRAYAEAMRRGLVTGEVGRGTFVRHAASTLTFIGPPRLPDDPSGIVDLAVNQPTAGSQTSLFAETLKALAQEPRLGDLLNYEPVVGRQADRMAGAAWIERSGLAATPARIAVTGGGQNGFAAVICAVTRPGDTVAVESLTYPGLKALANILNLNLVPVATDEEGLMPEAFAACCRGGAVRALYTMPSLHNPTTSVLCAERREAIAAIARQHDVAIIEDDVYGFLLEPAPPPIAHFAPELTYFVTSMSKSLAPGLRVGYVLAPANRIDRVAAALRATSYMATPLMAAIASRWINDGSADRLTAEKRAAATRRQAIAHDYLGRAGLASHRSAFHLWLNLPEAWRPEDFTAAALRRKVAITPSSAFAVGRAAPPNAIRISLGSPIGEESLRRGLAVVAELLEEAPEPHLSLV
jgi:DNA-binding transcriptional MocR family regulator